MGDQMSADDDIPSAVKDLASAVSSAAEVQNRYWLALAIASVFIVAPRPLGAPNEPGIRLPFDLGLIDAGWAALSAVLLLSVLVVAFSAAHAHLIRTQKLAFRILERRRKSGAMILGEDERDLLDALRMPSFSRVSSLSQVIRGPYQFFADKKECPRWLRWSSGALHFLFKSVVLVVWLFFPAAVLIHSMKIYRHAAPPPLWPSLWPWVVWPLSASAALSLFITACLELEFLVTAVGRIGSRER
jgi:hypothetical protein